MPFHHRASSLKQSNKKHKARSHLASKRSVKLKLGGKVNAVKATAPRLSNKQKTTERDLKQDRLNRAKQLKEQKRNDLFLQRRIGSTDGPTRVIALVGLSIFSDTGAVLDAILKAADSSSVSPLGNAVSASFSASKQRFTFLKPAFRVADVSEAAKVADLVILVLNVAHGEESCINQEGDLIISVLRSQGFPGAAGIIQGLKDLPAKQQADMRRYGNRFFTTELGDKAKVAEADNQVQLVRMLTTAAGQTVHWRSLRGYVMADRAQWEPQQQDPSLATLKLTGYVRGKPMSVNQLVHVTGIGAFHVAKIAKAQGEPCPFKPAAASKGMSVEGEEEEEVLAVADPSKQEGLEMLAEPNDMEGEQTWPTEEELAQAAMEGAGEKRKALMKKVGSSYQASWFLDMDDDDLDDFDDDEDDEEGEGGGKKTAASSGAAAQQGKASQEEAGEKAAGGSSDKEDDDDDDDDDEDDEDAMTVGDLASLAGGGKPKRSLKAKEDEDLEFPDEVDTPEDVPARQRFARYRALKSFRTSPWDPKESLPREYSRIFSFQSFTRAQARLLAELEEVERRQNKVLLDTMLATRPSRRKSTMSAAAASGKRKQSSAGGNAMDVDDEEEEEGAEGVEMEEEGDEEEDAAEGYVASGTYVTLYIPNVPIAALQERVQSGAPLLAFSLQRHENKVSVLHFNIQRHPTFEGPLPSKEQLVFSTGFRSFEARPVFSENNLNSDKHKFQRFLHPGRFTAASVYGPVTLMPCPLLVFKQTRDEATGQVTRTDLVATGMLASVDPDRVVLKKIVLSGYPVRVKKRGAVVKHMFYNPDDVRWFKPAELFTKLGAVGHIREPVGTHGLMKVRFNKVIKQSDTVCLALYKRVFPKFIDPEHPQVVCK